MSDLMLYGVLRMPYDLTMANELSRRQFYSRVQEAASRLEAAEAKLEELNPATPPSPSTAPRTCCACEGTPSGNNNPCAVCGRSSTAPTVEVYERAAAELSERLLNQHKMEIWDWDSLLDAANMIDRLRAALASKPPAREAAERQSIESDEFINLINFYFDLCTAPSPKFNVAVAHIAWKNLIAHIDTWGGAAPATGNTEPEE